jgi:hypothetical protein
MERRRRSKNTVSESIIGYLKEILFPEEPESKREEKKNKYYQNPFGGFLP